MLKECFDSYCLPFEIFSGCLIINKVIEMHRRPFSTSKAKITDLPVLEVETIMTRCRVGRSLPQLISGDSDRLQALIGQYKQSSIDIAKKSLAIDRYRLQKQKVISGQQHQIVWEEQMQQINETIKRLDKDLKQICEKYDMQDLCSGEDSAEQSIFKQVFNLHNSVRQLRTDSSALRDNRMVNQWLYAMYDLDVDIERSLREDTAAVDQLLQDTAAYRQQFSRRNQCTIDCQIPEDVVNLKCHDAALKEDLLQQFKQTAEEFQRKISEIATITISATPIVYQLPKHYQDLIAYVYQTYQHQSALVRQQMMLGRLKMEIHDVSAEELAAHLEMHTINHYLQMKRESIHESWLRIRQEFLGRVRQSISECNRTYNDNQKRVATTEQQEQRRIECRIQLNEWRKERYQQAMHEYEERMQQRAQLQALMEQQQSHWARARQRAKQRIDEYHKQLAEEQRKLDEMRQEKEKELALQQALDSRRNKERVEYRKEQLACKQKLAEAKQAEEQRRQESIREMLDRLRQQVAVQAERDPKRLLNPTTASLQSKRITDNQPLFQVNGYQDSKVLRDPRLRLTIVLADRGLLHSEYVRDVLISMRGDRLPRRDTLPSVSTSNNTT